MKKLFLTLTVSILFIPFGMSQELSSYVPTDGLVAYYPFNGNANDESGNGNHGTVNGATLANDQNGNENKAYEFTVDQGASWGSPQQEIEIGFNSSMNSNFLTLSAWVNPRVKPSPYNDRSHSIFGRWDGGVSNEIFRFGIGNDNALYFQINDGNNNVENYHGGNIPFDSWTHVAAVLNEKNIKLYVNGQMVSDQLFENNINTTGSSDLTIASMPMSNGTWYFFDGYLDEMGYWNRALTEQEVQNLYTSSTGDILLNGVVSAENNQIKNVADPTHAQDAVTLGLLLEKISNLQDQIDVLQSTSGSGTVTDQDGNSYPYLTYGDQVWTVKNAEMVTYRDGTPIPQVTDATEWANLTTGAWCYYDNDPNKGKLYNWYAVAGIHDNDENTPNKELAPEGWHVPSDAEWTELENYLIANGYNYDGTTTGNKIAKAMSSTTGWNDSTIDGAPGNNQLNNNNSGFNAFPIGTRTDYSSFIYEGEVIDFWSSVVNDTDAVHNRFLRNSDNFLNRDIDGGNKQYGICVRFVKD